MAFGLFSVGPFFVKTSVGFNNSRLFNVQSYDEGLNWLPGQSLDVYESGKNK